MQIECTSFVSGEDARRRPCNWVASASAFETFGNVPYEAAHCGTPALLQRAQGFSVGEKHVEGD